MKSANDAARENMLTKYAKVSKDGMYTPPPAQNAKSSYSTMVYVRATIVEEAGWHLARASTIAVSPKFHPFAPEALHLSISFHSGV